MCGICGFAVRANIDLETLKKMNDSMFHRGPDDSGENIIPASEYNIGLAQRRLSIIDLSAAGHQPMCSVDGRISVVFNGEIYNFNEIKKQLDYDFISTSDTEVIIAGYLKWGIDCIKKFNGMFAIALYDREIDTLYLIRDRIGKKPLYYWQNGKDIVFASELKPIMLYPGFTKVINTEIIARYLVQQYIAEPDTIFKDVYKLRPGEVLTFRRGEIETRLYWDLFEQYKKYSATLVKSYDEAKERLEHLINESVKYRMISDVPLGSFLSGGYDSSLVTAIAQKNSAVPVKTFTIGFHEKEYDESEYARNVADHLGTNHTEYFVSEAEALQTVEDITVYFDEPFADASQIPTMLVSRLAKTAVTVALSGDGGDELFCGYRKYDSVLKAQKMLPPAKVINTVTKLPLLKNIRPLLPSSVRYLADNTNSKSQTQIMFDYSVKTAENMASAGLSCKYEIEDTIPASNWQIKSMLLDMTKYLPGDILCKMDRSSMKYSLESRCPLLDVNVIEYSFSLPHDFKYRNGQKKYILKDLTHKYIPVSLMDRPKKGFGVPIKKWLKSVFRERLMYFSRVEVLKKQGIFAPEYTQNFIDRFIASEKTDEALDNCTPIVWSFFVFQLWYDMYMGKL